ncbi:arf-GAP with Rho-GAP domain, ANK repeat and PH domain-containing protein 1 isoform X2 [Nothobranchius furzeri]|uniref:arf-GAP with Rho-GAP domain, ANK repeat and PH domain-containing protein 1 isoform X2 n=1 Tax=Nothobranchius furzeri TaxID=105023 RepID=UPI003904AEDC
MWISLNRQTSFCLLPEIPRLVCGLNGTTHRFNQGRAGTDASPLSAPEGSNQDVFVKVNSIADIIATNIPSLAGAASAIGGPIAYAPSSNLMIPSANSQTDSVATSIRCLAEAANVLANTAFLDSALSAPAPAPAAFSGAPDLDRIIGSLSNIPSLAGTVSSIANPSISSSPSAPPLSSDTPHPQLLKTTGSADTLTDVGVLSQMVTQCLDQTAGAMGPSVDKDAKSSEEEKDENIMVLACWTNLEEADSESSNEDDTKVSNVSSESSGPMGEDSGSDTATTRVASNQSERLIPTRPAPPPPHKKTLTVKQRIPRAATIRVSRKKGGGNELATQSAVVRASWLDVWKGFRYSVLWATLDGQLMSLRKRRSDQFGEVLFHVSSITNIKPQDKNRFSIYFKKKHYDFMAHSNEVQEGWLTSLLATRGLQSPSPSEMHGQVTIKEPRSRSFAALWGHDLWIYPNRDSFQLGVASYSIPLNVASVKAAGKHSFVIITPYKSFSLSVDSTKDLSSWLCSLSSTIATALSCSQVSLRLWENPHNKICGDCGAANPEWASVNLLLVICHRCAGQHRRLGSNLSKVRSLRTDNKVWTEPLIQLFITYGNHLANQVWASTVPAREQLHPQSTDEERSTFVQNKYRKGCYKRLHALSSSRSMMNQRLCQVVVSDNVEETMSLICSGAKVCPSDPQSPAPILLAEKANQALQIELLRHNEYTDVPPQQLHSADLKLQSAPTGQEEEALHGKLEEDRFFFSVENDSAACDVLDLREVQSVFLKDGPAHQFELVTLNDQLLCEADEEEMLQSHLLHILKVILPGGLSSADVGRVSAVSKVCMVEVGGASIVSDGWLLLCGHEVRVDFINNHTQKSLILEPSALSHHEKHPSEIIVTMAASDRSVSLRFEEQFSCDTWFQHLQRALSNQHLLSKHPPTANQTSALYPVIDAGLRGSVPPAIERCISHITTYGLKVEGVYRRCGLVTTVKKLVEALVASPNSAPLENHEQGVLDAGSALKQYIRDHYNTIPDAQRQQWLQAAVISEEHSRFKEYRRLLRQLPDDNRATLNALFGHFYMLQVFSQVNKMSAQNLAVVLVPSLFQAVTQDLIRLTREFIIHHTLLFLTPESDHRKQQEDEEEQITIL